MKQTPLTIWPPWLAHRLGRAVQGYFVVLNCSAVVEACLRVNYSAMRRELSGAGADKAGLFEHAHEETCFLDEIDDMRTVRLR